MRSVLLYAAVSVAALALLSATASNASAQWLAPRYVTSYYYAPAPVVVAAPPVVYTPAPVTTSYYAPVTVSSYYAPMTVPSYYAPVAAVPAPVYAAPAPAVTVYRPSWLFRPRVVVRY